MAFSVNTNLTSLQAQDYLRMTSDFQGKTINRVTSGLRILQSGDDAAGLAVANGFRSDQAVLSQGIRNANDGLSALQTIDGGMSDISKLLDRARTLATQSASGTFTGDRTVLNSEFQNVLQEVNRQAQSIGMNTDGMFARNLSVFIGGGKGTSGAAVIQNGSVGLDLTHSTVDAKSLGLDTYRALNSNNYDLSASSTTSVAKVVANGASTANFYFRGPNFGNASGTSGQIDVSISTQGLKDTAGLAAAINQSIYTQAHPSSDTDATKAFRAAGIVASVVTDSSGREQLAFASANQAFQVHGDQTGNAFLGNIADTRSGQVTGEGATYVSADNSLATLTTDLSAATVAFGSGSAVTLAHLNASGGSPQSAQQVVDNINTDLTGSSDIQAELKNGKLAFYSKSGAEINGVTITGDSGHLLGFTNGASTYNSSFNGLNSGGVYQSAQEISTTGTDHSTDAYMFSAITAGNQTVTINSQRQDGSTVGLDITLDSTSGADVNTAVDTINTKMQASKDAAIQNIVAVRDGAGIRFMGTQGFTVTLGDTHANGDDGLSETVNGSVTTGNKQLSASTQGISGVADISNQSAAQAAVATIATAVQSLGRAQAVVGRGQNQFNYAVNLAQSQLSNLAAAESRIRDADLAAEAANMTKAQILLQAGVAALAQANSAPQQVLSLLRG